MKVLFLEFMIFSFGGYVLECIYSSFLQKRIVLNRGFLKGTYCPIYGVSLLCLQAVFQMTSNVIFQLFLSFFLIFFIEYITSFGLEIFFHRTWWDYSRKKFNLEGRVCLENLVIFGAGSIVLVRKVTPWLEKILTVESNFLTIFSCFLFFLFCIDFSFSFKKHYLHSKESC